MSDNITLPARGSGTELPDIATEDISGKHYQRVKIVGGGTAYTREAGIDLVTNSLTAINYPHKEIHGARHFYIESYTTLGVAATLFVKLVTPDTARWGHFTWEMNSSGILTATLDEDATGGMTNGSRPTIHANNRNDYCWTGSHTGGNGEATVMTDSTAAWTIDELIGFTIFNSTDNSSAVITDNDATSVTVAALLGGTGNDWDTNDTYEINRTGMVITSGVTTCTSYTQRVSNQKFGSKSGGGTTSREDELMLKQNCVYIRSLTSGTASNIIGFKASWYEHTNKTS